MSAKGKGMCLNCKKKPRIVNDLKICKKCNSKPLSKVNYSEKGLEKQREEVVLPHE